MITGFTYLELKRQAAQRNLESTGNYNAAHQGDELQIAKIDYVKLWRSVFNRDIRFGPGGDHKSEQWLEDGIQHSLGVHHKEFRSAQPVMHWQAQAPSVMPSPAQTPEPFEGPGYGLVHIRVQAWLRAMVIVSLFRQASPNYLSGLGTNPLGKVGNV